VDDMTHSKRTEESPTEGRDERPLSICKGTWLREKKRKEHLGGVGSTAENGELLRFSPRFDGLCFGVIGGQENYGGGGGELGKENNEMKGRAY